MNKAIHEKAIRLIEGGIVEVEGHHFSLKHERYIFDPCFVCEMDSLCDPEGDICAICEECDSITREDCYLVLTENKQ